VGKLKIEPYTTCLKKVQERDSDDDIVECIYTDEEEEGEA
jgi:hypothetical protein